MVTPDALGLGARLAFAHRQTTIAAKINTIMLEVILKQLNLKG